MNYELAKKLKDAGFPKETFRVTVPNNKYPNRYGQSNCPTLSELIEACGEDLDGIMKSKGEWVAMKDRYKSLGECFFGSTPQEAVARLWIELNK